MEARNRRTQKKPSEEANQVLQVKIKTSFCLQELNFELYLMSLMWNVLVAQGVLLIRVVLLTNVICGVYISYCCGNRCRLGRKKLSVHAKANERQKQRYHRWR
jgi:hypothetical protein